VHVVKLVADEEESNKKAVEEIKKVTDRLDVVVANAGMSNRLGILSRQSSSLLFTGITGGLEPAHTVDAAAYRQQFEVNTLGPLFMYQATYPLLIATREKEGNLPAPKFFVTSSGLGSLSGFYASFIIAAYGMSKAAVNYLTLAIHHQTEHVGAVVVPYHPGKSSLHPSPLASDLGSSHFTLTRSRSDRYEREERRRLQLASQQRHDDQSRTKRRRICGSDRQGNKGGKRRKVPWPGSRGAAPMVVPGVSFQLKVAQHWNSCRLVAALLSGRKRANQTK
jgi:NAD(P)-dependent dehydrogenase (short-subunit alcohol dehydrogenase family)